MKLQDFVTKYEGKYLEVAGSPGAENQCVDLANAYIREVLGLPIIEWTNAKDFPSKAGDQYTWIANSPTGVPQYGDLIIWQHNQYGHIAIYLEGNVNTFTSFDQNYPTGTPCHKQTHNYTSPQVAGWLRPKNQSAIIGSTSDSSSNLADEAMDNVNGQKAVQFDNILIEAHDRSITPDNKSENWLADNRLCDRLFDHIDTLEQVKLSLAHDVALQQQTIMELERKLQIKGEEAQTATDTPSTHESVPTGTTEAQKPIWTRIRELINRLFS